MSTIMKLDGIRGVIGKNMEASLKNTAQLSFFAEYNAQQLVAKREVLKDKGNNVGYEDIIVSILCRVIKHHPLMNGSVKGAEFHLSEEVHIGFAVPTESALIVPVLFDANTKSIFELNSARRALIERARSGVLPAKEMKGGTFTISNLGLTRVNHFTPILNYPQVALLGVGQITNRPWVMPDGEIKSQPIMPLSLTVDHKVIDGEPAGKFLTELCELLESINS